MKRKKIEIDIQSFTYEELNTSDRQLIDKARKTNEHSYAPYSHFYVGAAVLLDNGEIICGSNQENAASPSGTCAERTALFYAGAKGAYVCDLDGNLIADLGKYTSPAWCGNDYVVAVNATHDGHQYETSQIVLLKVDGSYKKELTKE